MDSYYYKWNPRDFRFPLPTELQGSTTDGNLQVWNDGAGDQVAMVTKNGRRNMR